MGMVSHLSDSMGLHVADIALLVAPFDPSGGGDSGADQHEAVHTLGILEGVTEQDVAAHSNADADVFHHGKVIQHLRYLQ